MLEGGIDLNAIALASAVFVHTVLPHQLRETPPLFHACSVKNITHMETITPASSAADSM